MNAERPMVKKGDWIDIRGAAVVSGVVSDLYDTRPDFCEVVHLDKNNKPIYEDVKWANGHWQFSGSAVSGGYAKLHNRLQPYVALLLQGRPSGSISREVEVWEDETDEA